MSSKAKNGRHTPGTQAADGTVGRTAGSAVGTVAAPADFVQITLDLEDAARAYTEVIQVLEALTRTTARRPSHLEDAEARAIDAMTVNLDNAWSRWDSAHRRLIGPPRASSEG